MKASRWICRLLVASMGLASMHAARADMIPVAAEQRIEASVDVQAGDLANSPLPPAGGEPTTTVIVFVLMFIAIFVLSLRPESASQ